MSEKQQTQEKFEINEFGEIIRPQREENSFRDSIRFDVKTTDEYVDEVITQFEKDLENGTLEKEEQKKKISHKVEKVIMTILCKNTKEGLIW